ncbi:MAG: leucine-rich repeat protein, partial [Prevotella sp.]|nr:leucine-rich repeat protein [Prevotella sp.]
MKRILIIILTCVLPFAISAQNGYGGDGTYNPSNPGDPGEPVLSHTVTLTASPTNGGSFNTSSTKVAEGDSVRLYAYTSTGFDFKEWQKDGETISTVTPFYYTMGTEDAAITAVFEYNPSNPENPAKNYWDATTGQVIVDDFTAGSLSSAVSTAIGGSSYNSNVIMITVVGQMSSNDFSIANNYTNCTLVDLSRTYGYTAIPSYSFDYTNLSQVILPSCVESVESHAFYNCSNLSEVSCYAIVPPTVGSDAFTGIAEGAVLRVLASSVSLYAEADGWKNFTILPLSDDVCALEVNLPEDAADGRYKNMTLQLVNMASGQIQKYLISDRVTYTFYGLQKNSEYFVAVKNQIDTELGRIEDIAIADEDVSVSFESLIQPQTISMGVVTPDGIDVTDDAQITWFDSSDNYLSQGSQLSGLVPQAQVKIKVSLSQTLGMQYVLPSDTLYTVQESGNTILCSLNPISCATLTGKVVDAETGAAIYGAVIT